MAPQNNRQAQKNKQENNVTRGVGYNLQKQPPANGTAGSVFQAPRGGSISYETSGNSGEGGGRFADKPTWTDYENYPREEVARNLSQGRPAQMYAQQGLNSEAIADLTANGWTYPLDIDGIIGPETTSAMQELLGALGFYTPVDGDWGPDTTSRTQEFLNSVFNQPVDPTVRGRHGDSRQGKGFMKSISNIMDAANAFDTPRDIAMSIEEGGGMDNPQYAGGSIYSAPNLDQNLARGYNMLTQGYYNPVVRQALARELIEATPDLATAALYGDGDRFHSGLKTIMPGLAATKAIMNESTMRPRHAEYIREHGDPDNLLGYGENFGRSSDDKARGTGYSPYRR